MSDALADGLPAVARLCEVIERRLPGIRRYIPFAQDHLVTEQWLKALGTDYTILRNGWYWENKTLRFPAAVTRARLRAFSANSCSTPC